MNKNTCTLLTAAISLLLSQSTISAEINVLRTDTGFYYPADKKHSDSTFIGYGDKNTFFGNRCHLASDYNLAEGSPVYATAEGEVFQSSLSTPFYGSDSGAVGGEIIIKHTTADNTEFYAIYGHVKNFVFSVGDTVKAGEKIADVGPFSSNGNAIPHLHFGINPNISTGLVDLLQGYTPSSSCSNFLGYVDPEVFITTNSARVVAAETCVALDDTASTTTNTILNTSSVLANDSDTDGDALSVSAADANSANGVAVTNNGDGTFTYTPAIDFTGTDSFSYTLTDSNGCTDTATVNITVSASSSGGSSSGGSSSGGSSSSGGGLINFMGLFSLLSLLLLRSFRRTR